MARMRSRPTKAWTSILRRFDGDAKMRDAVADARRFVEGFDAADPAIASAKAIADEWGSGVDLTSARPIGGYRPVFDQLLAACDALGVERQLATGRAAHSLAPR